MGREEDKRILFDRPIPTVYEQWNAIQTNVHIYNLLSYEDIAYLNQIARSNKLAGNPSKKKQLIIQVMEARGFKKLDCGTNRLVFKFMDNQSFLIKVAFDKVALNDNIREYNNQEYLKPFCAKCFEVTPCGTVGLFERVYAVKSKEEFASIANTVFDIIVNCFIGKFVLADFGTKFYKNWGVREGAYPVILDYPYLYELDGGKLFCNKQDPLSETGYCGGEIDYDDGFNFLVCKKCGKVYLASELSKDKKNKGIMIVGREETRMKIEITRRDGTVLDLGKEKETKTYKKYDKKETPHEYKMRKNINQLRVHIEKIHIDDEDEQPVEKTEKVQLSSMYGTMVPSAGDEFKNMKVTITRRDGGEYVGAANKNVSPYTPISSYANLYGSGAEIVTDEPESVIDSTATEVDKPIRNMDLSDSIPAGVYDAKYLESSLEPKTDQMTAFAENRIKKASEEKTPALANGNSQEKLDYTDTENLNELFMEETIPMDDLNKDDQIIAAHCDSDSIRYKINNLEMVDENQNIQDEEKRIEEFNNNKKEEPQNASDCEECKGEVIYSSNQTVEFEKHEPNIVPGSLKYIKKSQTEPENNQSNTKVLYNGKPMPNFEKDRNLKVLDVEALNKLKQEKQDALDQF